MADNRCIHERLWEDSDTVHGETERCGYDCLRPQGKFHGCRVVSLVQSNHSSGANKIAVAGDFKMITPCYNLGV